MQNPIILLIETATNVCSCALASADNIIAFKQSKEPNAHSRMLAVMIDSLLKENDIAPCRLSGVAVSKGPGSYTGLRIGVSTAKGICYALSVPLISIETLYILAFAARTEHKADLYLPMIDARRMEVYSAGYNYDLDIVKPVSADIIQSNIYDRYLKDANKAVLCGNGAAKCGEILKDDKYFYASDVELSAKYMAEAAYHKFITGQYEDVAYFEPYYLKDFVAAPSHIKGLYQR
ncbi:MAG: tRNA (adenosine(37)-N6)-threonylcarbamoyltransferase complex dimerization subunit type 1 TsaB [Bacteroidales bacterium]|jgi:tRNA threonylcarbamoyladenosine biosynthesis protein TsaB|nr:tRNA (adenosine(37)-N6)-threonylcarbamoyltransferase complex dimerization subunit type 1 TsaB [Bacteroidales bacterium]